MSAAPRPQDARTVEPARGGGSRELAVLAGLLVVLAVPRLFDLGADPPPDVMLDYLTDEGWWAHNARDHALFGRWIMDDHNEALFWAPLYTAALRLVFAVAGVGLVSTRLLAALAGLATCAVVYAFLRASHGWKVAAIATFLLGTDYFFLVYNRVGFVESFQAVFITAACLAIVRAGARPVWAPVAGALIVLALMAKVSAVVVGGVVLAYWAVCLLHRWRAADGAVAPFAWSIPLGVALGAVAAAALAFVVIQPDLGVLSAKTEQRTGMTTSHDPVLSLMTVGLLLVNDQIETSGFVSGSWPLLAAVVAVAVGGLAFRIRAFDPLATMCWCWLVAGAVQVGVLRLWQPDRRYLFMVPPLAILIALELGRAAGADRPRPLARGRLLAAAGLVGLFVGWVVRAAPSEALHLAPESPAPAAGVVWVLIALAVTPLAWVLLRLVATMRWRPALPLAGVLAAYAFLTLAPTLRYLATPTYTMRGAAEALAALGRELPPERRIAVGDFADTLGMESDLFTFVIRSWPDKNMFMNLDGWERFRPAITLDEGLPILVPVELGLRTTFALAPDRDGVPRRLIDVRVAPTPAEGG